MSFSSKMRLTGSSSASRFTGSSLASSRFLSLPRAVWASSWHSFRMTSAALCPDGLFSLAERQILDGVVGAAGSDATATGGRPSGDKLVDFAHHLRPASRIAAGHCAFRPRRRYQFAK